MEKSISILNNLIAKTMIRKQLQFYGRVQGVGFRYTAIRAANGLGIAGWVKNERDGSVTIEAQGSEAAIERMIATINGGSYIHIDNIVTTELAIIEGDKGFEVRY